MFSILHREDTPEITPCEHYDLLTDEKEIAILKQIEAFPKMVSEAAKHRAVNRICQYCTKLAQTFHSFYNSNRVIDLNAPELTNQRLNLVQATMITMENALNLIGVSSPEKM